jgi:hypothetical protein
LHAFIFLIFIQRQHQEDVIQRKVGSIGGKVISIHRQLTSSGSPFWIVGKGEALYKIHYSVNDIEQVGWVKFGLFPRWKL